MLGAGQGTGRKIDMMPSLKELNSSGRRQTFKNYRKNNYNCDRC